MTNLSDIRALVPHSGPMVLLDRVISVDAESVCAEVRIRQDSLFYLDGGVGAWVGLEYIAQAIAAYAGYHAALRGKPVKIGFLLGTRRYECVRPSFALGSVLMVRAKRVLQADDGLACFDCSIDDESGRLAGASVTVYQPADAEAFFDGSTA
jgi:predicted hotdog family 3-hydroxylacyl-ACP dehydratase